MITREDIDTFLDDDGELAGLFEDFYGSPQDAFEDMNDTLIVEENFANLYPEEQEAFFQFAYHFWGEYISSDGIDWSSMFYVWMGDE